MIQRVRHTAPGRDKYGDPLEGTTETVTLEGVHVAPRMGETSELHDRGRGGVVVGLQLYGPHNLDLLRTDQVLVDGELYEVEGEVGRWKSPFDPWEAGCETALRRAEG